MTIRFAITGSGFMGRTHAEAIRRHPTASLVALAGGTRAEALAADYGAELAPSTEALLRRDDIDAVVLTTPHHLHADEAILALNQGKHVLVEKPMATSVADCDRMIEAAERAGRALRIGYHQRFRINNATAQQLVRSGGIGEVHAALISMPTYASTVKDGGFGGNWAWWNDPASIGHVLNSAPHAIDMMRWLTGAEVRTVSAMCRTYLPATPVEDTTMALIEFTNGAICSFFSSRALPAPSFPGEDFRIRIMGGLGLLDLDPYKELRISDAQGWHTASAQPEVGHEGAQTAFGDVRMQAYTSQIGSFMDAIAGKPATVGTAPDGRAAIAAIAAMLTSSRTRAWVTV